MRATPCCAVEGQVKKTKKKISDVPSLWWHILVALRQRGASGGGQSPDKPENKTKKDKKKKRKKTRCTVVAVTGTQGRKPCSCGLPTDWGKFRELAHVYY